MTDSELQSQYAGYSDQQLAEHIAGGIPDWQAEQFRRLLMLRRRKHYEGLIDASSPLPEPSKQDNRKVIAAAKSRTLFVILGLILGSVGIHNYYAGYSDRGTIQLLLTLFSGGIGLIVTVPWALIEIFVVKSDSSGVKMT